MTIEGQQRCIAHGETHEINTLGPTSEFHGIDGNGFWHVISARPGMSMSLFNVTNHHDGQDAVQTEPCVSIVYLFAAAGDSWMLDAAGNRSAHVPLRPGRLYFTYAPDLTRGVNVVPPGARTRGLDIRLSMQVWNRITKGQPPCKFDADHAYCQAISDRSWVGVLPVSPKQRLIAQQLFDAGLADGEDLVVEARCLELVNTCLKTLAEAPNARPALARDRQLVDTVKQHIHTQLDQDWSIATLAAEAGVTSKRLKQVFPAHTGLPVYKYIQEARLSEAQRLLAQGGHRVTDVALSVGYGSLSHFSVLFRRRFGVSPSQYAKLVCGD